MRKAFFELYWRCLHCRAFHPFQPNTRPRRYCDSKCRYAAHYRRHKTKELA